MEKRKQKAIKKNTNSIFHRIMKTKNKKAKAKKETINTRDTETIIIWPKYQVIWKKQNKTDITFLIIKQIKIVAQKEQNQSDQ